MKEKQTTLLSIRLAAITDADAVAAIVAAAYASSNAEFKPDPDKIPAWIEWWISLSAPLPNEHRRFIENGLTYLIQLDETTIGTFRLEQQGDKSELDDFCILPQYQKRGYGTYALGLLEQLHDSKCIELATPYFCTANRRLYEKAGYKQVGMRSEDTVICYCKQL